MRNACIVVSTPFQALSACAITEQFKDYIFDLYIIGNFNKFRELAEKLKKTKIYRNVISYELSDIRKNNRSNNPFKKKIGALFSYFSFKRIEKIVDSNAKYEAVFFAAAHSALEFLFYVKSKFNPVFYMFDDGVMTYRNVKHCLAENGSSGKVKRLLEKIHGSIMPTLLLYMPELFIKLNGDKFKIEKLVPLSGEKKKIVEDLYDIRNNACIAQKALVIECKTEDYLDDSENEKLEEIYELLIKAIHSIAFKRHPRDSRENFKSRVYVEGTVPFEVINYIQDMTDIILIAWDSTSVITPKIFWNQEPRVLLLYKLVKGKLNNTNETDEFYQTFKHYYVNKSRFMIPSNESEFKECINKLLY